MYKKNNPSPFTTYELIGRFMALHDAKMQIGNEQNITFVNIDALVFKKRGATTTKPLDSTAAGIAVVLVRGRINRFDAKTCEWQIDQIFNNTSHDALYTGLEICFNKG